MEELLHLTSAVADAVNTSDSSDPRILESRQQLRYNAKHPDIEPITVTALDKPYIDLYSDSQSNNSFGGVISDLESDDNLIERAIKRQQKIDKTRSCKIASSLTDTGIGTLTTDVLKSLDSQDATGDGLSMRSDVSANKSSGSLSSCSTFLSGQASRVKISKKKLREVESPFDGPISLQSDSSEAVGNNPGGLLRVQPHVTPPPQRKKIETVPSQIVPHLEYRTTGLVEPVRNIQEQNVSGNGSGLEAVKAVHDIKEALQFIDHPSASLNPQHGVQDKYNTFPSARIKQGALTSDYSSIGMAKVNNDMEITKFMSTGRQGLVRDMLGKRKQDNQPIKKSVAAHVIVRNQSEPKKQSLDSDAITAAAVAASAAVAATHPFLKAQEQLEQRMNHISAQISQLKEKKSPKHTYEPASSVMVARKIEDNTRVTEDVERARHMERQLADLTNRRLDYLEMMQHKQMDVQAQLLSIRRNRPVGSTIPKPSALPRPAGSRVPSDRVPRSSTSAQDTHASLSGHPTSALDTPAPRSKPPQPIRDEIDKELAVTKDLNETPPPQPYKAGRFLAELLDHGQTPPTGPPQGRLYSPPERDIPQKQRTPEKINTADKRDVSSTLKQVDDLMDEVASLKTVLQSNEPKLSTPGPKLAGEQGGPAPLDAYLKSAKDLPPYSPYPSLEKRPAPQIYQATANSTALKTLQHVNQCRDNIEHNINAITKQHSERYTLPDTETDQQRIQKMVNKRIEALNSDLEREVLAELLERKSQAGFMIPERDVPIRGPQRKELESHQGVTTRPCNVRGPIMATSGAAKMAAPYKKSSPPIIYGKENKASKARLAMVKKQQGVEPPISQKPDLPTQYRPKSAPPKASAPANKPLSKPMVYPSTRTTQRNVPTVRGPEAPMFVHKQSVKVDPFYNRAPTLLAGAGIIQPDAYSGVTAIPLSAPRQDTGPSYKEHLNQKTPQKVPTTSKATTQLNDTPLITSTPITGDKMGLTIHGDTTMQEQESTMVTESESEHSAIDLPGHHVTPKPGYHGPSFPPKVPPMEAPMETPPIEEVLRIQRIQDEARDWIEQELMARIISEMASKNYQQQQTREKQGVTESQQMRERKERDREKEREEVPVEILGQSGVQFFVDAGMPIDDALVNELVRDVIQDQINNMAAGLKTTLDTEREPSSAPQDEPTDRVIIGRPRTHAPIESTNRAQQVVHNQVSPLVTPLVTPAGSPLNSPTHHFVSPPKTPDLSTTSEQDAAIKLYEQNLIMPDLKYATPAITSTQDPDITQEINSDDYYLPQTTDITTTAKHFLSKAVITPEITPPTTPTHNALDDLYTPIQMPGSRVMMPANHELPTPEVTDVSDATESLEGPSEIVGFASVENRDMGTSPVSDLIRFDNERVQSPKPPVNPEEGQPPPDEPPLDEQESSYSDTHISEIETETQNVCVSEGQWLVSLHSEGEVKAMARKSDTDMRFRDELCADDTLQEADDMDDITDISQSEGEFVHRTNIDPAREVSALPMEHQFRENPSLKTIEQQILSAQHLTMPVYSREPIERQHVNPSGNQQPVSEVGQSLGEVNWQIKQVSSKNEQDTLEPHQEESSASLGITGITPLAEDTGNLQSPPGEKLMSQSAPAAASSSEMKASTRRRSSVTAPVVASGEPRSSQSQRFKPTASPQNSVRFSLQTNESIDISSLDTATMDYTINTTTGVTSGLDTETQAMTPDQLNIEDLMKSRDYFNQSQSSIQSHDQQYSQSENYTLQSHDLMQTTSEVRHSGAYVDSLEGTLDRPDMDQVDIDPDTYTDGGNTYGQTRSSLGLTEGTSMTQDSDRMSRRLQPRINSVEIPTVDQFYEDSTEQSEDVSELEMT